MTISDIRSATLAQSPYFFTRDTLRFFGQRMSMFRVWKGKSGSYYVAAPSYWTDRYTGHRKLMGITMRKFTGSDLENVKHPDFHGDMEYAKEWIKQNG